MCGSSSLSLLLWLDDSLFRLELADPAVVLTQSGGQPQFSEQALVFLRHLHRKVLQSVLHLQNDWTSESVVLIDAVIELGRFDSCNCGL